MNLSSSMTIHPSYSVVPLLLVLALFTVPACKQSVQGNQAMQFTGPTMGTSYSITLATFPGSRKSTKIHQEVDAILDRINRQMSTYDPHSELSRFNDLQSTDWIQASPELVTVIHAALKTSRLTDGAFDATVGPLVTLWGFGPGRHQDTLPAKERIEELLTEVGYEYLHIRHVPPAIKKDNPNLSVDLSAIAKGYAVDQVANYLDSLTIDNYLVEIGGELRARGHNAEGMPWRIAIERPTPDTRTIYRILELHAQGLATSGDYRNFFEKDGRRYSHTINPQTGKPVTHNLTSVTVIAKSSMQADALATGLLVLGPKAGYTFAQREHVAALFITHTLEGFQETTTPELQQYLADSESLL